RYYFAASPLASSSAPELYIRINNRTAADPSPSPRRLLSRPEPLREESDSYTCGSKLRRS
ncbi:MAG: hypothetical protein AAGC47_09510, partial [Bacteroidota bacterium]